MFEKVNPAHPDKIADRIANAIVDAAYRKEDNPKIAVEVLIGHGMYHIITETSVHINRYVDIRPFATIETRGTDDSRSLVPLRMCHRAFRDRKRFSPVRALFPATIRSPDE